MQNSHTYEYHDVLNTWAEEKTYIIAVFRHALQIQTYLDTDNVQSSWTGHETIYSASSIVQS